MQYFLKCHMKFNSLDNMPIGINPYYKVVIF